MLYFFLPSFRCSNDSVELDHLDVEDHIEHLKVDEFNIVRIIYVVKTWRATYLDKCKKDQEEDHDKSWQILPTNLNEKIKFN